MEDEDEGPKPPDLLQQQAFRKQLNQEARDSLKNTMHEKVRLILHRCPPTAENRLEYAIQSAALTPVISELVHKTAPLLEQEAACEFTGSRLYGEKFCAGQTAFPNFRYFAKKQQPENAPSLAVALRIDESSSMAAFGRLEAAKQAAIALYEFCCRSGIPILICGDTADRSPMEQTSFYSYVDFDSKNPHEKYALMNIQARSNNRDGMALRVVADRLLKANRQTRLCISISDGQPRALPDYTGNLAVSDMKAVLREYRRKGILFLAAAIGQDRDVISDIYGKENTLDITDLKLLPARLIQIIARYL